MRMDIVRQRIDQSSGINRAKAGDQVVADASRVTYGAVATARACGTGDDVVTGCDVIECPGGIGVGGERIQLRVRISLRAAFGLVEQRQNSRKLRSAYGGSSDHVKGRIGIAIAVDTTRPGTYDGEVVRCRCIQCNVRHVASSVSGNAGPRLPRWFGKFGASPAPSRRRRAGGGSTGIVPSRFRKVGEGGRSDIVSGVVCGSCPVLGGLGRVARISAVTCKGCSAH